MLVDDALAELAKQKRISKGDIMNTRRRLNSLDDRRTIKLQYRAIDMTMPIASTAEEVEMRVMCGERDARWQRCFQCRDRQGPCLCCIYGWHMCVSVFLSFCLSFFCWGGLI